MHDEGEETRAGGIQPRADAAARAGSASEPAEAAAAPLPPPAPSTAPPATLPDAPPFTRPDAPLPLVTAAGDDLLRQIRAALGASDEARETGAETAAGLPDRAAPPPAAIAAAAGIHLPRVTAAHWPPLAVPVAAAGLEVLRHAPVMRMIVDASARPGSPAQASIAQESPVEDHHSVSSAIAQDAANEPISSPAAPAPVHGEADPAPVWEQGLDDLWAELPPAAPAATPSLPVEPPAAMERPGAFDAVVQVEAAGVPAPPLAAPSVTGPVPAAASVLLPAAEKLPFGPDAAVAERRPSEPVHEAASEGLHLEFQSEARSQAQRPSRDFRSASSLSASARSSGAPQGHPRDAEPTGPLLPGIAAPATAASPFALRPGDRLTRARLPDLETRPREDGATDASPAGDADAGGEPGRAPAGEPPQQPAVPSPSDGLGPAASPQSAVAPLVSVEPVPTDPQPPAEIEPPTPTLSWPSAMRADAGAMGRTAYSPPSGHAPAAGAASSAFPAPPATQPRPGARTLAAAAMPADADVRDDMRSATGAAPADDAAASSPRAPSASAPTLPATSWPALLRRGVRYAGFALAAWLAVMTLVIVMLRFVDPPGSMLMAWRGLSGHDIEHRWVALEDISDNLKRAVIVSEDGRFCRHWGIDPREIVAAIRRARDGTPRGASTITMQVAKNMFLWPSKSYLRKALEVPLTFLIEIIWSKRRILEVYLNIAEWGPDVFGAEAAARHHYGKSVRSLSQREAALLAVALPNPIRRDAGRPGGGTQRLASAIQARMRSAAGAAACVIGR